MINTTDKTKTTDAQLAANDNVDVVETHKVKDKGDKVEETKKTTYYDNSKAEKKDKSKDKDKQLKKEKKDKDTIATYKETTDSRHHTGHHLGSHHHGVHDTDKQRGSWNDLSYPANTIAPNNSANPYISQGYNPNQYQYQQQPYGYNQHQYQQYHHQQPIGFNQHHQQPYGYNQHPGSFSNVHPSTGNNRGFVGGHHDYNRHHESNFYEHNRGVAPLHHNDHYNTSLNRDYDRGYNTGSHFNDYNRHPADYNRGFGGNSGHYTNDYYRNYDYGRQGEHRGAIERAKEFVGIDNRDNRNFYDSRVDYNRQYDNRNTYDSRNFHPGQTNDYNRYQGNRY